MKTENRYQRNLNRLKGWCDGAGAKPMRSGLEDDPDYELGYTDGQKAKRDYADKSATALDVSVREIVPLSAVDKPDRCTCPSVACKLHGLPPRAASGGW